jgi:hypothetical protein
MGVLQLNSKLMTTQVVWHIVADQEEQDVQQSSLLHATVA